ncbi:MAG: hypothetical protein M0P09_06610, partial [Acholeplasmataceae bacterium]|nr:hypothetical protein [Acholeplasmataceae bacterium]
MPSLIYIQWGIIGFFVGIHFLLGFFRGASKSTYFTVVHLIMTIVTLWLVSIFTVRWFFNSPDSIASVLNLVKQYTGFELDEQIITAITTPEVFGLILWFVDIVIKIIAYYTLYPVVKSILTLLIFRPIWKHAILKPMLARQHLKKQEAMAYQYHQQQIPAHTIGKPSKKLKKSFLGRFVGAFVGGIRGAVIAFVFLLPILVIVSFSSNVYAGLDLDQRASHTELGTNLAVTDGLPSGVVDILEMIDELNEKSLFKFTQNITISNQTFDRFIFDRVFSSTIKVEEETIKISLGNELEQFLGIGLTVLESGYLDDGFNPSDISEDDLAHVEQVFTYLGRSDLIQYIIPAAARYGVSSLIPEMLDGVRLDEREASSEALELFYQISWDDELGNIYGVLEAALQFRSVGEWQTLITNPELIAELSPEEATLLSNIFRRIGDIQTLTLLNIAIDYLTTLDDVQKQITWIAQEDREDYLQDRFAFILDNPEFFVGEESDFYQIALLIDTIFSEEFGETHLSDIYDNINQIDQLFDLQNPQWVSQIIDDIVGIKLFIESVPFGVDFAFYTQLATDLDEEMTDRIISELELINWRNEISNVKDIYVEVLKLGVGVVFGDNPDYFAIVDDLALNHMDSIRTIVDYIFEGSEVVNIAIELAVPYFLDDLVDDPDLHNLLIEIMYSDPDSDLLDFNFGLEVKNILNIVEVIYQFTTIEEVLELQGSDNEEILTVVSNMGLLETEEFDRLSQAFYDLQILSRAGQPGLNYLKTTLDIPYLYVPQTVELNKDIQAILNLVYETAKYLSINSETAATLSEIDFTALLKDENYRAYFLSTPANKHSNLLFTNIAYNLQYWSAEEAVEDFIHIPTILETAAIESIAWKEEVNHLLTAIFDFAVFVGESPSLSLSLDHLTTIASNPLSISIEALTQLNDLQVVEKAFGNIDASYIFRSSFVNLFNTYGEQFKDSLMGYALQVPEHLTEDDMLKEDVFVNFIHGIMTLVADLNETLAFSTFEDAINFRDFNELATAFNQAEDASIRTFGSAKLIHGIISEVILNSDYQQVGRDAFNNLQLLNITVDASFLNISRPNNLLDEDEFSDLLISLKALQLSPDLVSNLQTGLFTYINDLEETQLDKFFASYLLRELLDQVIANDAILDGVVGYVQDLYGTIQGSQALLSNLNPNFSHIIKSLPSYKDQDGFFDTDEFKAWILAFKELELASMDELKALSNLETAHQKIAASFVVETLFESRWFFNLANDAFTSETTLNQLADLATTQAQKLANSNYTFTAADVSLTATKYGVIDPVTEKIKVSEIKNFLLAGTRLNWLDLGLGGGLNLAGNLSQELMATGYDSERHIDIILNSKIVLGLFDKVLNFEHNNYPIDEIVIGFANERLQGIGALSGLTLEPSILHYDIRAYDNNNVIRKEEIIEMVEAVTYIDLSGSINVDTFYQMIVEDTFKELFDSKIIHSWISNALNNAAIQSFGVDKANELQSFIVVPADFLTIDPILMDGDLFKVDEIENIIIALHELGLTNSQSFNQLGVSTFTNLLGRNVDPITHEDDFDRVLKAGYVYIILDRTLKLNSIGDFVADKLGGAIGVHIDHIDTTPSPAMLGDHTKPPIEVGRLPKQEFRNILISLDLLGDINAISLNRFMDMVDPYEDEDDFTTFMNSDYIYTIVARLLDHQAFGDYIGDQLAAGFANDPISLDMSVPTDAQGQAGVEEDLMKKTELRRLMISFKLVDFDGGAQMSVGNIFGMIDRNVDPMTQKDDYHRFLESIYIQDKMSQLLLSEAVIEIIANGRFDPVDFVMPASSVVHVDGRDRLIPQELYDLLYGLHLLG